MIFEVYYQKYIGTVIVLRVHFTDSVFCNTLCVYCRISPYILHLQLWNDTVSSVKRVCFLWICILWVNLFIDENMNFADFTVLHWSYFEYCIIFFIHVLQGILCCYMTMYGVLSSINNEFIFVLMLICGDYIFLCHFILMCDFFPGRLVYVY